VKGRYVPCVGASWVCLILIESAASLLVATAPRDLHRYLAL